MPDNAERIRSNFNTISDRIADAAMRSDRSPDSVKLIAVTKSVGVDEVRMLSELGQMHFGENRIEVARKKIESFRSSPFTWHMIGNVQRRKARDIVELFNTVDAIDRIEVAEALNKRCEESGKKLNVLVEVNVSGEDSKHGFNPTTLTDALEKISLLPYLKVDGLMTMAPFAMDPEETRPVFRSLKQLADQHGLDEISMGMTNDFEVAIEEGATQVRIGTALFV